MGTVLHLVTYQELYMHFAMISHATSHQSLNWAQMKSLETKLTFLIVER